MSELRTEKLNWDDLISECEERIKALKSSLRYFREMRDAGEQFPIDAPSPPHPHFHIEL